MRRKDIKICIMRAGGTNCDDETRLAFENLGVRAEAVHTKRIIGKRNLLDYHGLVFPGGFSYGDYVRAGAIWADVLKDEMRDQLRQFADSHRPILGICNGFQVLVETGLLPGFSAQDNSVQIALAGNVPSGYRCTWVTANDYLYLKNENSGKCVFTHLIKKERLLRMPIAHAEGRVLFPRGKEQEYLKRLVENDQIVFRFARSDGKYAEERFPFNPNESFWDIAGICNAEGTVMGMMPHPERAYFGCQQPDWTRSSKVQRYGDGRLVFESMISHILRL